MSFTSAITGDAKRISAARKSPAAFTFAACAMLALSGCHTPGHFGMATATSHAPAMDSAMDSAQAQSLASIKEVFDATAEEVPTLTAVGYAVVSLSLIHI